MWRAGLAIVVWFALCLPARAQALDPVKLCAAPLAAGFIGEGPKWQRSTKDPTWYYCTDVNHDFPGTSGGNTLMYEFQIDGDAGGPESITIETNIFADRLYASEISETLLPLLRALFSAAGQTAPSDLIRQAAAVKAGEFTTALGRVTMTYSPGERRDSPYNGARHTIFFQLPAPPSPVTQSDPNLGSAQAYYDRGYDYIDKKEYDKALRDFTKAIELDKGMSDAYHERGWIYNDRAQYDLAIRELDEAIRLDPKDAGSITERAYSYRLLGRFARSIQDATQSLELRPNDVDTLHGRAMSYFNLRDHASALQDFDAIVKIDAKHAQALYGRGVSKRLRGDVRGGDADIAAARLLQSGVAESMATNGVKP